MTDPRGGHESPDPARIPLVGPPPSLGGTPPPPRDGDPQPYVAAPAPPRGRRWVPLAAMTAVAVLAGGFGIVTLLDGDGADSPEAAVEALFAAVDDEDVIGALEALDPDERRVLLPAIEQVADEARRLDLASPELDLGSVDGVDLVVEGLSYDTEPLGEDLVAVDLTGGSVTGSTDLDALPMGALLREVVADDEEDPEVGRLELDGVRLVARRSGGGWYVSAGYSVAEQARRSLDPVPPVPDLDVAVAPAGADSPEAAVRQAVDAAIALDVAQLIDLTAPGELPALHHYGPMLVAEAEAEAGTSGDDGDDGDEVELLDLQLEVAAGPDSTATVTARSFEVRHTSTWSGGSEVVTWTYDGSCLRTTWEDEADPHGVDDVAWCEDDAVADSVLFLWGGDLGAMGVVTVEEGGRWYVSPTRSVVDLVLGPLRGLDRDQAHRTVRWWVGDWWVAEPDGFWEACGVDRPSLDTSSEEGEAAYERCWDQLPDDYEGSFFGDGWSEERSGGALTIEGGPGGEPWEPTPEEAAEMACYEDGPRSEVEACLSDLVDAGTIDEEVLVHHRCEQVFDDLFDRVDDPTDEQWDAADADYEACVDDGLGG